MAKAPGDRFASASELARALAGSESLGTLNLPKLDDLTLDAALLEAPEPIAEAVVTLDAASDAETAYRAAWRVVDTLAHYVGAIALGCRARIRGVDTEPLTEHLVALRARGLDARGWWHLAREIARPFATIRDAFPVPELIGVFFDGHAELNTALDLVFAEGAARIEQPNREVASTELTRLIPTLGSALRALRWLDDYRLVVPNKGGAQRWMGARRSDRATIATKAPMLSPALVNADGEVVVDLDPVAELHAPVPGAPRQLFFIDGPGRHGARLRALPTDLEHEVADGWGRLAITGGSDDDSTDEVASPYMGLATFTEQQSSLFFGRERELEELLNRLQTQSLIAIVGPSGAGKSSFVRAGLFPALGPSWRQISLRPGPNPLASLTAAIAAAGGGEVRAVDLLHAPEQAAARLRTLAEQSRLVVFVDQFEELFTLSADAERQLAFANALVSIAEAGNRIRVVLTLRDDFLVRAAQVPALKSIASWLQILTTPAPDDLHRILVEPARRSGFAFEDAEFSQQIVSEVANQPGALALLSFTASQLWTLRDRLTKQLIRRAYRALGGVGGALAQHAEKVLGSMPPAGQRIVRELFRHLVTAEGTRAVLSREELAQVGGGPDAAPVIETLITERLLTAMEAPTGESIEVVHETLLVSWPRLVGWRSQDAENARLRDQLRLAARQWQDGGRPRGMLWRGETLAEYQVWRARYPGTVTASEDAFGASSVAEADRNRRIRRSLLVATIAALVVALVVFARLRSAADASREVAQSQLLGSYLQQAERSLSAGDAFGGLVFADGATRLGADSFAQRFLIARALDSISPEVATMSSSPGIAPFVGFLPDGSVAAIGNDAILRRWSATGALLWSTSPGATGGNWWLATDPTGHWIATAAEDSIDLWTLDGHLARQLRGHHGQIAMLKFSADGRSLLSTGFDGTGRIWDLGSERVRVLDTKFAGRAAGDLVGDRVVVVGSDDIGSANVVIGSRGSAAPERVAQPLGQYIPISVAISADGRRAAFGSADGPIHVWDLETRSEIATLTGHEGAVTALAFSKDGQLVSGGVDSTVRVWSISAGRMVRSLVGHHGQLKMMVFAPDGRLLTGAADGTARLWDISSGSNLRTFTHGGGMIDVAVNKDASRIATASGLGTVKIWRTDSAVGIDPLAEAAPDPTMTNPWVSTDGTRLLRASSAGCELWDLTTRRLVTRLGGGKALCAATDEHVYVADGAALTIAKLRDGAPITQLSAPFGVEELCIDPAHDWIVVGGKLPGPLAVLDDTGRVLGNGTADESATLICEPNGVAAFGDRVTFFASPDLARRGSEQLPSYGFARFYPGLGIVSQSARTDLAVWQSGVRVATIKYPGLIGAIAVSDGNLAVGLYDGAIVERQRPALVAPETFKAHGAAVRALASDTRMLASIALDGTLQIREHGVANPIYEAHVSPLTYWAAFAGDSLVTTDGDHVELQHLDVYHGTADELARLAACKVPDQVRAQLAGPPPAAPCADR